jgi:hypothetical protein
LKTTDHFSSNWTSRVVGGKRHQLVVELAGVVAGRAAVADHRVAVHLHQPGGGADAGPLGEVLEERERLSSVSCETNRGAPLRSEKRALQVRQ